VIGARDETSTLIKSLASLKTSPIIFLLRDSTRGALAEKQSITIDGVWRNRQR